MKCDWLDVWLQALCMLFFLCLLLVCENVILLDQRLWGSAGSIILESSNPGSGITACQLRVKYFSTTTTPLFFSQVVALMSLWSHGHLLTVLVEWRKGGGGHIKKAYRARREEEEMFLCIILHMWSSWRSVSMNSLSAPMGKHFSAGIWGMKPEVLCFDPCAVPPPSLLPAALPSPSPPRTRFHGLGQRLVVLSPSAAETWYQESPLSSSFIAPSQVRLFTSFIYCSPTPPSLPSETANTKKSDHLTPL